jgi:hypothetical protein
MLTKRDYEDAISVQDACNLSGVVHSWSRMMDKIWKESRAMEKGTDFVNRHPINVMFADKVASLTGSNNFSRYSKAYEECQERIEEMS